MLPHFRPLQVPGSDTAGTCGMHPAHLIPVVKWVRYISHRNCCVLRPVMWHVVWHPIVLVFRLVCSTLSALKIRGQPSSVLFVNSLTIQIYQYAVYFDFCQGNDCKLKRHFPANGEAAPRDLDTVLELIIPLSLQVELLHLH